MKLLRKTTLKEKAKIQELEPERRDIITAGGVLLDRDHGDVRDRDPAGLREVAARQPRPRVALRPAGGETNGTPGAPPSRGSRSAREGSNGHAARVRDLALRLFDVTHSLHQLTPLEREWLEHAALLHDVGLSIAYQRHHHHSYYLIVHGGLKGFSRDEVEVIAQVARYHRKALPSERHQPFRRLDPWKKPVVEKLSALLRLADGLDRTHRGHVIRTSASRCGGRRSSSRPRRAAPPSSRCGPPERRTGSVREGLRAAGRDPRPEVRGPHRSGTAGSAAAPPRLLKSGEDNGDVPTLALVLLFQAAAATPAATPDPHSRAEANSRRGERRRGDPDPLRRGEREEAAGGERRDAEDAALSVAPAGGGIGGKGLPAACSTAGTATPAAGSPRRRRRVVQHNRSVDANGQVRVEGSVRNVGTGPVCDVSVAVRLYDDTARLPRLGRPQSSTSRS